MLSFAYHRHHRDLHSFPTRRSSDLQDELEHVIDGDDAENPLLFVDDRHDSQIEVRHQPRHFLQISIRSHLPRDRKSTRLNSSHPSISYAVFCLKKKKKRLSYASMTM